MSLRSYLRKIAGRVAGASRSKRGANSHVNTKKAKRQASKAYRHCYRAELIHQTLDEQADALVDRFFGYHTPYERYERTFYEDHHLDIPDELQEKDDG